MTNTVVPLLKPAKDRYAKLQQDNVCVALPLTQALHQESISPSIAVICHLFHIDLVDEFQHYFSHIPYSFDLYITTNTEEKKLYLQEKFSNWSFGKVDIRIAPNRGRDIAPKLITCHDVYDRYEYVLHVHSKKTNHASYLERWRHHILDTLLGTTENIKNIFTLFQSDPTLGMIAPQHYDVIKFWDLWGENYENAHAFAEKLGIGNIEEKDFDFPSGSMFWARSAALKPILQHNLSFDDFEEERNQTDGTLAHAIERLYFFICEKAGYRWLKVINNNHEPKLNVVTIIAKNYLAFARTLTDSIKKYHPDANVYVVIADKIANHFEPQHERFITIGIEELRSEIDDLEALCFQYNILELCTALKPFALEYLFKKNKLSTLIYFDPDILVTHNLQPLLNILEDHSIVLTPHVTKPYNDQKNPSERTITDAGVYNLGFIALANTTTTFAMLDWWQNKLYKYCLVDFPNGFFTDQRWIDLVPGFYETYILRDPGYNVAYWNLHERTLTMEGGKILCNQEPLYFFHFSGHNTHQPHIISKHQNRHCFTNLQVVSDLFSDYRKLLIENGHFEFSKWTYYFDFFANGDKIPECFRRIYWELSDNDRKKYGNPFATGKDSFYAWLTQMNGDEYPYIIQETYRNRVDLQTAFPDIKNENKLDFLFWFFNTGIIELKLSKDLFASIYDDFIKIHYEKQKIGVNIFGYFNSEKGLGEAVRSDMRCLEKTPLPLALCNIIDHGSTNLLMKDYPFSKYNPYKINLLHINAEQMPLLNQIGTDVLTGHYNIGSWAWELSQLPEHWYFAFNALQEIWVLSSFMQQNLAVVSPIPVVKMPLSIAIPNIEKPKFDKCFFGIPENKFVFLFMFDFHSTYGRKNPAGTVQAFMNAFTDEDDAVLIIKYSHGECYEQELEELLRLNKSKKIIFWDKILSREQVNALFYHADCYVSLHRSEGFGLTMAEAMSLGKPVIATGYSGNLDFMNPSNSYLVNYKLVTLDQDYGHYKNGCQWAEPDLLHAAQLMRHVYEHQEEAIAVGQVARNYIQQYYNPEAVAKIYRERIEAIIDAMQNTRTMEWDYIEKNQDNTAHLPKLKINFVNVVKLIFSEPVLIKKFLTHLRNDGLQTTFWMLAIKTNEKYNDSPI